MGPRAILLCDAQVRRAMGDAPGAGELSAPAVGRGYGWFCRELTVRAE